MSKALQLHDTDGSTIAELTTDGHTLKPFLNTINQFVDEAKIHFTPDGIHATAVNPANVAALTTTLPADAIENYNVKTDDHTIGVNVGAFRHLIRRARMGSDDSLYLQVHERRLYATVTRGYDDADVVTEDRIDLIDPDSIRQEPDMPELDLHDVDVGIDAFRDVTSHAAATGEYIELKAFNGTLTVSAEDDTRSSSGRVYGAVAEDTEADAIYSRGYVNDLLDALKKGKADSLGVRFAEEMPLMVSFERTGDEGALLEGEAMIAPRLRSE